MSKYLNLKYFFEIRPDTSFQYSTWMLVLVGLLLAVAILVKVFRRKAVKDEILKKILKRIPGPLFGFAIALLVLLLFRLSGIPFFSMRIWWIVLALVFVVWVIRSIVRMGADYRNWASEAKKKETRSKFLPRKKR
jgi:small-conductance mechanosensitive channel